jgi:signal peptidase II
MIQRKYLVLLAMVGMLVSFDQLTKLAVISNLRLGETQSVIENFFNITRVHNTGAAFGLLANLDPDWRESLFFFVPGVTLAIIFVVFFRLRDDQVLSIYSISLIIGGATGNLADRMRLGYVVDFVDLHWKYRAHFPAFNVADSAITIGVILLLLGIFYEYREEAGR